jgi:hypothetical protein
MMQELRQSILRSVIEMWRHYHTAVAHGRGGQEHACMVVVDVDNVKGKTHLPQVKE